MTAPASADVDNTITDGNNETGQATIEATVPAGAIMMRVTTDNGTDHLVPVNGYTMTEADSNGTEPTPGSDSSGSNKGSSSTGSSKEQQRGFWPSSSVVCSLRWLGRPVGLGLRQWHDPEVDDSFLDEAAEAHSPKGSLIASLTL